MANTKGGQKDLANRELAFEAWQEGLLSPQISKPDACFVATLQVWGRAPFQQRLRVAASQGCGAAWWLWLCRQAAVWAAVMLAVGLAVRWRRCAAVSTLVLAGCLGEVLQCSGLVGKVPTRRAGRSLAVGGGASEACQRQATAVHHGSGPQGDTASVGGCSMTTFAQPLTQHPSGYPHTLSAGLLTAVAWQQAERIVRERMPHLSAAGRLQGVGPLAAATLLQPFARDWGNMVFWWASFCIPVVSLLQRMILLHCQLVACVVKLANLLDRMRSPTFFVKLCAATHSCALQGHGTSLHLSRPALCPGATPHLEALRAAPRKRHRRPLGRCAGGSGAGCPCSWRGGSSARKGPR